MAKGAPKAKEGTEILPCTCKNDFQDTTYGKNRRVFNLGTKAKTCTVCGSKKAL